MATGRISLELSYLILLFSNLILYSANQQSAIAPSRYFFERVQHEGDENEDNQEEAISLVEFHRCSLDEQCSFVVKKSKDDNLQRLNAKEINFQGYYAIWKKVEKTRYTDCKQARGLGVTNSGVVKLQISPTIATQGYCDMLTDGGGWTVFQRRQDGSVNFYRDWKSYKEGFGDVTGNYWLGLEALHQLTSTDNNVLRIELIRDDSYWAYADYNGFKIQSEAQKYKLEYTSYIGGTAGDALWKSQDRPFSTYDNDNDAATWNCAASWKGGWWHNDCFFANLNNDYYNASVPQSHTPSTMSWVSQWTDLKFGRIIYSEMKLRRL